MSKDLNSNLNLPFSARIGISIFLVCGVLSISTSVFIYNYLKEKIWQTTRTQLTNITNIYAHDISILYHKEISNLKSQILSKGIERKVLVEKISNGGVEHSLNQAVIDEINKTPEYQRISSHLKKEIPTRSTNSEFIIVQSSYILIDIPESPLYSTVAFLFDNGNNDVNQNGKIDEEENDAKIGDLYEVTKQDGVALAFSGKVSCNTNIVNDRWGVYISSFAPILDDKKNVIAVLGIDIPVNNENNLINIFRFLIGITIFASFLISLISGFILAKYFDKPIRSLIAGIKSIESQDYTVRIPVISNDEIGQLAASFNQMIESIKNMRSDLLEHTNNLEKNIKERTIDLEISNQKALQARLELDTFNQITLKIIESNSLDKSLYFIFNHILGTYPIDGLVIYFPNQDNSKLIPFKSRGIDVPEEKFNYLQSISFNFKEDQQIFIKAFNRYKNTLINKKMNINKINNSLEKELFQKMNFQSMLWLPIKIDNKRIAMLFGFTLIKRLNLKKEELSTISRFVVQISGILNKEKYQEELKKARILMEKNHRDTSDLNQLFKNFSENMDLQSILNIFHTYIKERFGINYYGFSLMNPDGVTAKLKNFVLPEFLTEYDKNKLAEMEHKVIGIKCAHDVVLKSKKIFFFPRSREANITPQELLVKKICKFESIIIMPLKIRGKILGFIDLFNVGKFSISKEDLEYLSLLGEEVSISIYNTILLKETEEARKQSEVEMGVAIIARMEAEVAKNSSDKALRELKESQTKLVRSEKMAALGQLVDGVAHEMNTPLGAIKASAENIVSSIKDSTDFIPELFKNLDNNQTVLLMKFLKLAVNFDLTAKEERQLKKQISNSLEKRGIEDFREIAGIMVFLGYQSIDEEFDPLWKDPQKKNIIKYIEKERGLQKKSFLINISVEKTAKIVSALKSFTGASHEKRRCTNIVAGIEDALIIYGNYIRKGITLHKKFDEVPTIMAYPEKLIQVWNHLLSNAIGSLKGEGEIKISVKELTKESSKYILVSFEDNGPGISDEIKDMIFEPFFTTKKSGEGAGLGLHVCKQIISLHKGEIYFDSKAGQTIFSVIIPQVSI